MSGCGGGIVGGEGVGRWEGPTHGFLVHALFYSPIGL